MAGTVKTKIDVLHTDIVFISENISRKLALTGWRRKLQWKHFWTNKVENTYP